MFRNIIFSLSLLGIALTFEASVFAQESSDPFARDVKILAKWFEGEFDNSEQLWFQNDPRSNTAEQDKHTRIHTTHTRIELPEFGEHVFYVEEYAEDNPENIVRQRFVTFSTDTGENAIRMKQGFFKSADNVKGGLNLDQITDEDVVFLEGCDVFWRREAGQFRGKMKPKSCVFGEGGTRRYSVHNLVLSESKYWRVDTTFLVSDDSLHVGKPVDKPFELRRARRFTCDIIVRPADQPKFFRGADSQETQVFNNMSIHTEGGSFDVERASDGQIFTFLMRAKEYPYYEVRPDFLYFSIRKKGEESSVAYTANDLNSRILSAFFDGIAFNCYRDGYNFRETIEFIDR